MYPAPWSRYARRSKNSVHVAALAVSLGFCLPLEYSFPKDPGFLPLPAHPTQLT